MEKTESEGLPETEEHNVTALPLKESEKDVDVWNIEWKDTDRWKWDTLNSKQKCFSVFLGFVKFCLVWLLLYLFIISLSLLGSGFQILGGTSVGEIFRNSQIFNNPFASCAIGILATVMVQSSSTSTSIIISMAAAELLTVGQAVYMVMGANIGTSITNTLVAIGQINDVDQFRRAFGGATVHDMFNFLSVMILLPIEWATGMLKHMSSSAVKGLHVPEGYEAPNFLKLLTKPVTSKIMSVDKGLISKIGKEKNATVLQQLMKKSIVKWKKCKDPEKSFIYCPQENRWTDASIGLTLTVWALIWLSVTLILLVKLLQWSLQGSLARVLHKVMNLEIKNPFNWLSDYVLVIVGIVMTILVQSSSVTTSSLTPLVGIGLLKLHKMFPVTVGANVGTTATGILAAMGNDNLNLALQVAFSHLFFNFMGILLWFIIPFMRNIPIELAKGMGNTTAKHRWFAAFYILMAFVIIPLILFGLANAGPGVFAGIVVPFTLLLIAYLTVLALRKKKPEVLPPWLLEFYWLPEFLKEEPECLKNYHNKMIDKAKKRDEAKLKKETESRGKNSLIDKVYISLGDANDGIHPIGV